jgi:IS5 family transposase
LFRQKNDKDKIYSLHEPHVECIAKGKANKAYEFGDKVSIDRSRDIGITLGDLALPGSPCDGHTIDVLLKQLKRINGTQAEILIVDHGYPGEKYFGKTQFLTPSLPTQDDTEYKKRKQSIRFRKRASIEASISHLKQDCSFGNCFLKGVIGNQTNLTLAYTDFSLKTWIRSRLDIFFNLFYKTIKNMSLQ